MYCVLSSSTIFYSVRTCASLRSTVLSACAYGSCDAGYVVSPDIAGIVPIFSGEFRERGRVRAGEGKMGGGGGGVAEVSLFVSISESPNTHAYKSFVPDK